jgi:hypothetical protein
LFPSTFLNDFFAALADFLHLLQGWWDIILGIHGERS